jgi:hypothetical protein
MQEFADAAPEGVEVIACQPGEVTRDLDAYLLGNVVSYTIDDLRASTGRSRRGNTTTTSAPG